MNSLKKPVQDFTHFLINNEVEDVIICPGSRNAPFIIDLANHPKIKAYSIIDERSAAFFALGIAQQKKKPAVVVSTSGTASLNFGPALAEAFYQRIPLIAVTADRPEEWIDQGEGQSIRQKNVFANYCKASFDIGHDFDDRDRMWYHNRMLNEAFRLCMNAPKGPVHLNFHLRESLYLTTPDRIETRFIKDAKTVVSLSEIEWADIVQELNHSKRVLVLAGQMEADENRQVALEQFATLNQVIVFTETHSHLNSSFFIASIDRWIMAAGEKANILSEIDLLITIGNNVISRKIKDYLRKSSAKHWHVDEASELMDTYRILDKIIPLSPAVFFEELKGKVNSVGNFRSSMLSIHDISSKKGNEFIASTEWSDLKAIAQVMVDVPANYQIQMGNSSVVRYIQLYDQKPGLTYFGNRGVSGIDGCSSTALGAAYAGGSETLLISGDIAFFYDSNAFWNKYVSPKLKIVIINNGGGGIFRIIDGPASTGALETFFETAHTRTAESLCAMYSLPYKQASNERDLSEALKWLFESTQCSVLEIKTPPEKNDKILKNFFNAIKVD
jgi:2-succinyl-5-enolpyruvyl-6-hydroxy-3-cyclohexene-1-carboxylate synthase